LAKLRTPLAQLAGDQLRASNPADHAALSASAGTGKTHVLTARVLRLLLSGVDPSSILCLTFTKAGAAEMAERIHERLAYWVRLKDADLGRELMALGESPGPEMRETARTLFARVLDAAGGGLRIQTIHAFAQSLLAAFPAEAGLVPASGRWRAGRSSCSPARPLPTCWSAPNDRRSQADRRHAGAQPPPGRRRSRVLPHVLRPRAFGDAGARRPRRNRGEA
jgi:ATP-dependent helicase/nuclease subunit A